MPYATATTALATAIQNVHQRTRYSAAGSCSTKNAGSWLTTLRPVPVKRIRARDSETDSRSPSGTEPAVVVIAERSAAASW